MKPKRIIISLIIISLFCLWFCFYGRFVHDELLTGNYRLIAVDVSEQMSVCYSLNKGGAVGRINETVYSVGWDNRYIVAKQHPKNDRTKTNFFYLEMAKDSMYAEPSTSVKGPLTAQEFTSKQSELKLPNFTRTIKDLE